MSSHFPPNSRYYAVATATFDDGQGRAIAYLRRRFLPPPERLAVIAEHEVAEGERLDLIAAAYLEDPEQFWRLCDGHRVLRPTELTDEVGRRISITLPAGLQGPTR